eukprot:10312194-Prorocentrum_lima.AAC.1
MTSLAAAKSEPYVVTEEARVIVVRNGLEFTSYLPSWTPNRCAEGWACGGGGAATAFLAAR